MGEYVLPAEVTRGQAKLQPVACPLPDWSRADSEVLGSLPSLFYSPSTMTAQKPVPIAMSHEPPSPGPFLDSPAFASAWLLGKGNKRLKLVTGKRP